MTRIESNNAVVMTSMLLACYFPNSPEYVEFFGVQCFDVVVAVSVNQQR